MGDISRFILKVMALLAFFSAVGVAGVLVIVSAHQDATGAGSAVGWVTLCALAYLLCVDRITVSGVRNA
jgi:hypothetical protein